MSRFDFTQRIRETCVDMIDRLPELGHIDMSRVALSVSRARNRSQYGHFASLTPLRFQGGALVTQRRGRTYTIQRVRDADGREMLYILTFYLPRFLDLDFREKLVTIVHELWHISPQFDGDIRRHEGRCYAHTGSQKAYDEVMGRMADRWLESEPALGTYDFLRDRFDALAGRHGAIVGVRYARPKLLPLRQG